LCVEYRIGVLIFGGREFVFAAIVEKSWKAGHIALDHQGIRIRLNNIFDLRQFRCQLGFYLNSFAACGLNTF